MVGLGMMMVAVSGMIAAGWLLRGRRLSHPRRILVASAAVSLLTVFLGGALVVLSATGAWAAEGGTPNPAAGWAFLGASLSTGLACIGAGVAVGGVGAAALGVVSEKPDMLGMTLIYLGLAEGIAIYGVIISLLVLGRV